MSNRIEIYVGSQALELPEAASLEAEINSPAFSDELVAGSFSWPIQIPMTPTNRRIYEFADLPESRANFATPRVGRFVCDGLDVECQVALNSVKKDTLEVQLRLSSSIVAEKLSKYSLRQMDWPVQDNVFVGSYYENEPMPAGFTSTTDRDDYLDAFTTVLMTFANAEPFPDAKGYVFGIMARQEEYGSTTNLYNYYPLSIPEGLNVQPQLQALSILRRMAVWLGISLEGSALNDRAMQRVVCYSGKSWPLVQTPYGITPSSSVDWSLFAPPILAGDWFKAFCRYFFLAPFWSLDGRRLYLEPLRNLVGQPAAVDWTDKIVAREAEINQEAFESYKLIYSGESSDKFSSDYFKDDWTDLNIQPGVSDFGNLPSFATEEEIRYAGAEDFYYQWDSRDLVWKPWGLPLRPFNPSGDKEYNPGAGPVWSHIIAGLGFVVPRFNQQPDKVETPRFMNWLGMRAIASSTDPAYYLPQLSHLNKDGHGDVVPFCDRLTFEGDDGIYARRGKAWLDAVTRTRKTITVPVFLTAAELGALTLRETVRIGESRYLIKQIKAKFPIQTTVEATLYQL